MYSTRLETFHGGVSGIGHCYNNPSSHLYEPSHPRMFSMTGYKEPVHLSYVQRNFPAGHYPNSFLYVTWIDEEFHLLIDCGMQYWYNGSLDRNEARPLHLTVPGTL